MDQKLKTLAQQFWDHVSFYQLIFGGPPLRGTPHWGVPFFDQPKAQHFDFRSCGGGSSLGGFPGRPQRSRSSSSSSPGALMAPVGVGYPWVWASQHVSNAGGGGGMLSSGKLGASKRAGLHQTAMEPAEVTTMSCSHGNERKALKASKPEEKRPASSGLPNQMPPTQKWNGPDNYLVGYMYNLYLLISSAVNKRLSRWSWLEHTHISFSVARYSLHDHPSLMTPWLNWSKQTRNSLCYWKVATSEAKPNETQQVMWTWILQSRSKSQTGVYICIYIYIYNIYIYIYYTRCTIVSKTTKQMENRKENAASLSSSSEAQLQLALLSAPLSWAGHGWLEIGASQGCRFVKATNPTYFMWATGKSRGRNGVVFRGVSFLGLGFIFPMKSQKFWFYIKTC